MAHEVDYDTDLFAEMIRSGRHTDAQRDYRLVYEDEKPKKTRTKKK
jgi:hypothetical protein